MASVLITYFWELVYLDKNSAICMCGVSSVCLKSLITSRKENPTLGTAVQEKSFLWLENITFIRGPSSFKSLNREHHSIVSCGLR